MTAMGDDSAVGAAKAAAASKPAPVLRWGDSDSEDDDIPPVSSFLDLKGLGSEDDDDSFDGRGRGGGDS